MLALGQGAQLLDFRLRETVSEEGFHICNIYNIKFKQQNLFGELLLFGFST